MKVKEAMSKDAAMSVLGLKLTTEGKNKKPLNLTDYTEDELLVAFRETCAVIGILFRLSGTIRLCLYFSISPLALEYNYYYD